MKGETRNHPNAAPEGHIAGYDIPDLKQSQPIENAARWLWRISVRHLRHKKFFHRMSQSAVKFR